MTDKVSVLIPSLNETYLTPTLHECFANARGELEVIVVLQGGWPADWKELTEKYPNLHTIHYGEPMGLRVPINAAAASAISRGTKFLLKLDAHCKLDEGYDEKLKADIDRDWVGVPRRKRLDAANWKIQDVGKPDIDYHFLSFPNDPNDFGGKGLNGKVWEQRAKERLDKPEYDIDDEMSSQGSCWFMHADYFQQLELMDESSYGPFWNEFQEIGLKCWLSGGQVKINKKTWYAHLHKGKEYKGADGKGGRGYHLKESWLAQGRNHTMLWPWNEAWGKQTLPFKWLIEHFWPVPGWPEDWEEVLYAERKPRDLGGHFVMGANNVYKYDAAEKPDSMGVEADQRDEGIGLMIHSADYGLGSDGWKESVNVTQRVRSLVRNDSLDIVVNNATLTPGQNPFRGKKKALQVAYSYNGGDIQVVERDEKDWLIIGQAATAYRAGRTTGKSRLGERYVKMSDMGLTEEQVQQEYEQVIAEKARLGDLKTAELIRDREGKTIAVARELPQGGTVVEEIVRPAEVISGIDSTGREWNTYGNTVLADPPRTAIALNDYLIRKFSISGRRLRAPMPIELPNFHRNDLAQLFAELGFKRGAEIGVAEGHYSEVLLKANPQLELLLLVDPWMKYSDNPRAHSEQHQQFSLNETKRKTAGYDCVKIVQDYSMNAVRDVEEGTLDWVYIDGHHSFDWVVCDIVEWAKRVRSGGCIAGDDYFTMKYGGVVEAVNAYTRAHGIDLWFLCDAPRSVDWFFVKP